VRTKGIENHLPVHLHDLITDEQYIPEKIAGESRGVTADVYRVETAIAIAAQEKVIEGETPAEIMVEIVFMDGGAGREEAAVLVTCAKKMVVSESDGIHPGEGGIECGRAVDQEYCPIRFDPVSSMFISQFRDRIETGYVRIDVHSFQMVIGRIFICSQEFVLRRPAERAEYRVVSDHVIPADLADILFNFPVIHIPHQGWF
jgi:hypothetical protein